MDGNKKVVIIVVNWNGSDFIELCLEYALNQTHYDFQVVLIDNNSTDDSLLKVFNTFAEEIKETELIVLPLKKNVGFAEGNNIGIRFAMKNLNPYAIALLNPDAWPDTTWLNEMLKKLRVDNYVGMVAPKTLLLNGAVDTYGLRLNPGLLGKDVKDEKFIGQVICPSGCAGLYSRKYLEHVKQGDDYFDADFFMYCEDVDIGLRGIRNNQFYCIVAPKAIVHHVHGGTQRAFKNNKLALYYNHRNNIWTIYKNFNNKEIFDRLPQIIYYQLLSLGYHVLTGYVFHILKSKYHAFKGLGKMKNKRLQ